MKLPTEVRRTAVAFCAARIGNRVGVVNTGRVVGHDGDQNIWEVMVLNRISQILGRFYVAEDGHPVEWALAEGRRRPSSMVF